MRYTENISIEMYHAMEGLSASGLPKLEISPAHYQAYKREERDPTPSLGSLIHLAVLEPAKFETDVVVVGDLRKTENKNKRDEALASGKFVAREGDYESAKAVQLAVKNHKMANFLVTKGQNEISGFARDNALGIDLKIRPDCLLKDEKIIVDLKSISPMNSRALEKYFYSKRYNYQSAFYRHVNKLITGDDYKMCHLLVEVADPYAVRLVSFSGAALDLSFERVFELIKTYGECVHKDEWPGYSEEIVELGLPNYAMNYDDTNEAAHDYK